METAWNSFLSVYIIAIASSNNIFVNKRGGGGQGVAIKQAQMGVNGQKLIFRQMVGDGGTMGWKQPGIACFLYMILQQNPVITVLSIKGEVESRGFP